MAVSEGIRRLSLVLGLLGAAPGTFFFVGLIVTAGNLDNVVYSGVAGLVGFVTFWGGVRVIAWIAEGFRGGST
jgi:hypothetical protein